MSRLFGTDGVRGVAGTELTPELAVAVGSAAVTVLAAPGNAGDRPLVAVGRDPRPSGDLLQAAVVAGVLAAGADVVLLGVVPTPAVARAVADGLPGLDRRPAFGVVVSASHNPMPDNGIKLFGAGGTKLSQADEDRVEAGVRDPAARVTGSAVGRVVADLSARHGWYVDALLATLDGRLDGVRVVVDCANGSAASVARDVYAGAGADVTLLHDDLSGVAINDGCGATHLDSLRSAVVAQGAQAGIAHDGDADRCLAVTAAGDVVDGDAILAILAIGMHERGELAGDAVAATVMSNAGLATALRAHGVSVEVTSVGDRAVTERMHADGLSLGGEQSGHVVLARHATTGDGILTGLHLLARMAASQRPLAELAAVVRPLPQVLVNVVCADRDAATAALQPLAAAVAAELGDEGRVLVRASGTEPLVRVMVEAPTEGRARELAERLAAAVR